MSSMTGPLLQAGDAPAPRALLVLGMHRSGTSAAAGALRLAGVDLGDPDLGGEVAHLGFAVARDQHHALEAVPRL